MKTKNELAASIFGLLFLFITMSASTARAQYGDYDDDVSLETFYEELSPYGVWINDPQYGRVWRPDVDQDEFRPYYTRGHWEMTKYGNTWVSDYDWGWAPFHYGRWQHQNRNGWIWIPGTKWGPAWVSWRSGGGHYGWAPMGPGINININIGRIPNYWWVFIPQRNIYYDSYPRYNWRRNNAIYYNTVIINNIYVNNSNRNRYYTGPRADEIRRVTRQPVTIYDVRSQRPRYANGRDNRPEVNRGTVSNPRPSRPTEMGRGATNGRSDNDVVSRTDNNRSSVNGRVGNQTIDRSHENAGNRGSVTNRPDRVNSTRQTEQVANRQGEQKIPASSQRSSRTYDNQEIRGNQSSQAERQVTERQSPQSRPSAPQREQRTEQPQQRPQQQREVSHGNSNQRADRSSSPERGGERTSSSGGRPARVQ